MMSPGRTIYAKLDWTLILCYILLAVFGWLNIYASTYSEGGEGIFSLATRSGNQLMWIGIAAVTAFVIIFVPGTGCPYCCLRLYCCSGTKSTVPGHG